MKQFPKILPVILVRSLFVLLLVAVVCVSAFSVLLGTVFHGSSETARDLLAATLLEHPQTAWIPGMFLDAQTLSSLSTQALTPNAATDTSRITPSASGKAYTGFLEGKTYTAQITYCYDASRISFTGEGGIGSISFSEDGILCICDASARENTCCDRILLLNGEPNEALYAAVSGYAARTAIGQCADGTLILVKVDEATLSLPGATYSDLIDLMTSYGAVNACSVCGDITLSEG